MGDKKLNKKRQLFIDEYLIDLNGAAAVLRAGYKTRRPDAYAYDLLRIPEIAQKIKQALEERSKKLELSAEMVVKDIIRRGKLAEEAGQMAAALKASELLGRHLAMFTDKLETPDAPDKIIIQNFFHTKPPADLAEKDPVHPENDIDINIPARTDAAGSRLSDLFQ